MNLKNAGRNLLIGIAALLFLGAAVSIWALEKVGRLSEDAAREGQKVERLLMTGARVQTDFQVQIQEFKNILLRGEDTDLFRKHLDSFKKRRDAVQEGLDQMSLALEQAGMDKSPAEQLLLVHSDLSFRYGEAAKLVRGMGIAAAAEADKSVRGIDRETSKGLSDLRALIDAFAAQRAEARAVEIAATTSTARLLMLGMTLLGGLAVLLSVHLGLRRLLSLIGGEPDEAVRIFSRIAAGDLTAPIPQAAAAGSLMAELGGMQQQLRERTDAERQAAAATLQIKRALDNASACMMLVSSTGDIVYTNRAMQALLREHADALGAAGVAKERPTLSGLLAGTPAADWVGALGEAETASRCRCEVAGLNLLLLAQGVLADDGQRIGTVVEWQDHTAGVVAERQIEALIEAVLQGDFTHRVPLAGKQGFHRTSAEGLNNLAKVMSEVLAEVGRVLNALANGDLTQKIVADYQGTLEQLKIDTNTTVDRLREMLARLQAASTTINVAAGDIACSNADLSRYTEAQASVLEETASSMEELNATVHQNAENAKLANQQARDSNQLAAVGGQRMEAMVATMGDIQQASHRIEAIIGVIDSIAFQTNILALNAAVEAARAGEQGRGFAVVAAEVRNLAQRSAAAAQEIKGLIADSVDKVGGGVRLVQQVGKTMQQIVSDLNRLSGLVTEIADASGEQSAGIAQVTQAVAQMDEAMQKNAARVEAAAAAAAMLTGQSADFARMVQSFRVEPVGQVLPAPVKAKAVPALPTPPRQQPVAALTLQDDEWTEF